MSCFNPQFCVFKIIVQANQLENLQCIVYHNFETLIITSVLNRPAHGIIAETKYTQIPVGSKRPACKNIIQRRVDRCFGKHCFLYRYSPHSYIDIVLIPISIQSSFLYRYSPHSYIDIVRIPISIQSSFLNESPFVIFRSK